VHGEGILLRRASYTLQVVATLVKQATKTKLQCPSSLPDYYKEFFPKPKSSYDFTRFCSASLMGLQLGFAWEFAITDDRRTTPMGGRVLGRGSNAAIFTGIDCKLLGMCGQKTQQRCNPSLDLSAMPAGAVAADAPDQDEEPEVILHMETTDLHGWRCSFAKNTDNEDERLAKYMCRFGKGLRRVDNGREGVRLQSCGAIQASTEKSAATQQRRATERRHYLRDMKKLLLDEGT
jgi:hypothetical protein